MAQMRLFKEDGGECDILIVHADGKDYAVAAPSWEAITGYLVEFRVADTMTLVGKVVHQVRCKQFDDTWTAIKRFTRILDVVNIYKVAWSEDNADT